ncbi:MAG: FKBP-type peptidyl-prolyl cis-trans isomerase [Microthrixaceae bacterium]
MSAGRGRRAAAVGALGLAGALLLAGCGDDSSSGSKETTTTEAGGGSSSGASTTVANTPEAKAVAERGEPKVPTVEGTTTELKITDDVVGTGTEVKAGDTVTVQYVGALASNGKVFDASWSRGEPITFSLDQVIPGWSEGLVGMKAGGRRTLVIPAAKAYGATPPPGSGIPANADLVFVVDLISVP